MQSAKAQEQLLREHLQQITLLLKAVQGTSTQETEPHSLLLVEVGHSTAAEGCAGHLYAGDRATLTAAGGGRSLYCC